MAPHEGRLRQQATTNNTIERDRSMAEAHAHELAHDHPHPNYMAIFWWLLGITIAEVAVTFVPMSYAMLVIILLVMAFAKAILVALYFMHLKFDNKILMVIAAVPVVLAGIAIAIISYEYANYTISDSAKAAPPPPAATGH
jgi:cytochrome c oxidase subunit 4